MKRKWRVGLLLSAAIAFDLSCAEHADADEPPPPPVAAPLPSKDIRWAALVGGGMDVGSLPHASPEVELGFDVRRGALGLRLAASAVLPQTDHGSAASAALFDFMAMICALAPFASRFDVGACGGLGAGLLRAARSSSEPRDSGASVRPQGLAITRLDMALLPALLLTLDAGTVIDPLRTTLPLAGGSDTYRASLFSFRSTLGVLIRVW